MFEFHINGSEVQVKKDLEQPYPGGIPRPKKRPKKGVKTVKMGKPDSFYTIYRTIVSLKFLLWKPLRLLIPNKEVELTANAAYKDSYRRFKNYLIATDPAS